MIPAIVSLLPSGVPLRLFIFPLAISPKTSAEDEPTDSKVSSTNSTIAKPLVSKKVTNKKVADKTGPISSKNNSPKTKLAIAKPLTFI